MPETLKAATELLISGLHLEDRKVLMSIQQSELRDFDSWELGIRNSLGLWWNVPLRMDCGGSSIHPDDATIVIMKAVWNQLNGLPIEDAKNSGFRNDWPCMAEAGPVVMYRRLRYKTNGKRHPLENILRKMKHMFPMDLDDLTALAKTVDESDAAAASD